MVNMSPEDFAAFKEKSGFKEPQSVKVFYEEAEKHRLFLQHHAERRALNRTLRSQQCSLIDRVKYSLRDSRRYDGWPEY
jgi:hypothetical protein